MNAETVQQAARAVHAQLPDVGFILIVTPFGDGREDEANYVSNCNREDAVKILKVLLYRWGIEEDWMTKAK